MSINHFLIEKLLTTSLSATKMPKLNDAYDRFTTDTRTRQLVRSHNYLVGNIL
jgi:hypothetical protein